MLELITNSFEWAGANKNFIVLLGILSVGIYHVIITKVQQQKCFGRFDLQDYKIGEITKDVEEVKKETKQALDLANKAHICVINLSEKFDDRKKERKASRRTIQENA